MAITRLVPLLVPLIIHLVPLLVKVLHRMSLLSPSMLLKLLWVGL